MISFKSFVQAIQGAVNSANEQLIDSNTKLLDQFFTTTQSGSNLQGKVQGAVNALEHISQGKQTLTDQELNAASEVIKNLGNSIKSSDESGQGVLTPKTISMEYPVENADGTVTIEEIQVPLITLAPINMSQVNKATFNLDFELEMVNDEVQLHFTKSRNAREGRGRTRGNLQIELSPAEPAEGLKALIEGYERVLKSQIQ